MRPPRPLAALLVLALPAWPGSSPTLHPPAPTVVVTGRVLDPGGAPLASARVTVTGTRDGTHTDAAGRYTLTTARAGGGDLRVRAQRIGFDPATRTVRAAGDTVRLDFVLRPAVLRLDAVTIAEGAAASRREAADVTSDVAAAAAPAAAPEVRAAVPLSASTGNATAAAGSAKERGPAPRGRRVDPGAFNTEGYARIDENPFTAPQVAPMSTFSIDVDHASYANVRRFLDAGQRPPADAVRLEELVNYFPYANRAPRGDVPFAVTTEVGRAPWSPGHQLVRIALQARRVATEALPPSNLVFLIDVSGSMQPADKLPLVKQAFRLLVNELRAEDRVAIVVYAGAAGLVLPPTPGSEKERILAAIDRLEAGGSTAGGAGLRLAYDVARAHHRRGTNSRVVLATDGDFNVGESSDAAMVRLVERRRDEGTALTVLGVGTGNLQDAKMEQLADRGNGNYAYLDNLLEAQKALVHEMGGTLVTVAKDVKLQVEFNPRRVAGYRLLGYENRALRAEDFDDDAKDAGELGAGHAVTALYEVIPVGASDAGRVRGVDAPRYAGPARPAADDVAPADARAGDELLYVKLRYKRPAGGPSRRVAYAVPARTAARPSADFTFASAVAMFGLVLRDSEHRGTGTLAEAAALARRSLGGDPGGYRAEFVRLAERAAEIIGEDAVVAERR